jgi:hypothetical protein
MKDTFPFKQTCFMRLRLVLFPLLFGALLLPAESTAQDVIMAKGNAQITLGVSAINLHQASMEDEMHFLKTIELDWHKRFDYELRFSKPLNVTAEYALSSYTTIGLNVNYFSYTLSEQREDDVESVGFTTNGRHLDFHLRALRYFYATPRSALYLIGEAGIATRSVQYKTDKGSPVSMAYINTFPETKPGGFRSFSYDYGIGWKVKLLKPVGLSAEFTQLAPLGRYGIFYNIQPAGRRAKDAIGW